MSHSQNFLPNLFVARANRGSPLKEDTRVQPAPAPEKIPLPSTLLFMQNLLAHSLEQ